MARTFHFLFHALVMLAIVVLLSSFGSEGGHFVADGDTTEVSAAIGLYPSGSVHCIRRGTEVKDVTNPATGFTWMDRNLGASRAARWESDRRAYGDLYQWGRFSDGHQCRNSDTTSIRSFWNTPGHGEFIVMEVAFYDHFDWRYEAERRSWSSRDGFGAFSSPLKLPLTGYRCLFSGAIYFAGSIGYYWSSTFTKFFAYYLGFSSKGAYTRNFRRADGRAVRCIKDGLTNI